MVFKGKCSALTKSKTSDLIFSKSNLAATMGAQCTGHKCCSAQLSMEDISCRFRGPRPLYGEELAHTRTGCAFLAGTTQDTSHTMDIMTGEGSGGSTFAICDTEKDYSPSPEGSVIETLPGYPTATLATQSSTSRRSIKLKVQVTYDVDMSSDVTPDDNLFRMKSEAKWTPNTITRVEQEMTAELEQQQNSLCLRSHTHNQCIHSVSPSPSAETLSDESHSELISDPDLDDHAMDSSVEMKVEGGRQLDSPKNVFREDSAQRWSEMQIDKMKSEMAKQLVHLQSNMVSVKERE